jgi:hypothetical protein
MSTFVIHRYEGKTPIPATGIHAELLAEASEAAAALIKLIELERSGVFDGFGQGGGPVPTPSSIWQSGSWVCSSGPGLNYSRRLSSGCDLCRQNSERCEARRSSGRAADQDRICDQSKNRKGTRP